MTGPEPKYDVGQELRLPEGGVATPTERERHLWGGHVTWAYKIPGRGWRFEEALKDAARSKPYSRRKRSFAKTS